jgi:REP element-mobilizing transposase RayT
LEEMCGRSGIVVHAYALLDNHYHLVVETPEGNLVEGIRWLQNTYTRRFNVCHQLWGHLFGGRYKALLVELEGEYFWRLVDYVHLNPARAGIVDVNEGLEKYTWSSLSAFMRGPRHRPRWLAADRVFRACELQDTARGRKAYLERLERRIREEGTREAGLVNADSMPEVSLQTTIRRGWYFGSEEFKERMLALLEKQGISARHGIGDGYHGEQTRDHGEARARKILEAGCEQFGLGPEELRSRKANDEAKIMVAEVIGSETSVRLDWLREELAMGSRGHCSRLINDHRRRLDGDEALRRRRARLVKKINIK